MFLPIIMFGATLILFAMLQLLDPYQRLALYINDPAQLKGGKEELDRLIDKHGLSDPLPIQYARWIGELATGNLGYSETANEPVVDGFKNRFPATAELAIAAFIPIVFFAIMLGVKAAVNHNKAFDQITRLATIFGYSLPTFVLGLGLLFLFYGGVSQHLPALFDGWFAPGRLSTWAQQIVNSDSFIRYTGMMTVDALLNGDLKLFWNAVGHLLLPVITLSYGSWAAMLRVMRSSMLETLRQDYVTTARSKGLSERVVVNKHARRNALIPIATFTGFLVVGLLTGVVITETIFSYPGLGNWLVKASTQLDIAAVLGLLVFVTMLYMLINLIVDVVYVLIDPRIRLN